MKTDSKVIHKSYLNNAFEDYVFYSKQANSLDKSKAWKEKNRILAFGYWLCLTHMGLGDELDKYVNENM